MLLYLIGSLILSCYFHSPVIGVAVFLICLGLKDIENFSK